MDGKLACPWNVVWHDVLDRVDVGDAQLGRRYLYVCGRWNSELLLSALGRLADAIPPRGSGHGGGKPPCDRCNSERESGPWTARSLGIYDEPRRLYIQRGEGPNDNRLHHVLSDSTFTSSEAGGIYLTTCGIWIEQARVKVLHAIRRAPIAARVCRNCLRFDTEGGEPGNPEVTVGDEDQF
jgi:hypothetical protein